MRIGKDWIHYEGPAHIGALSGKQFCDMFQEKLESIFQKKYEGRLYEIEGYRASFHPRIWVTAKQAAQMATLLKPSKRNRFGLKGKDVYYSGILDSQTGYGVKCSVMVPGISKKTGDKIYFQVSHVYYHISQVWGIPLECMARYYNTYKLGEPEHFAVEPSLEEILVDWTGLSIEQLREQASQEGIYKS